MKRLKTGFVVAVCSVLCAGTLVTGCSQGSGGSAQSTSSSAQSVQDSPAQSTVESEASASSSASTIKEADAETLRKELGIQEDYRKSFVHGDKTAEQTKYIMLHDTETTGSAADVINDWDKSGNGVAAHFVVGKDGTVMQCVSLDKITHHAGFGNTGHNQKFGVEDDSRDDKAGTKSIGSDYADYGMNSWSVGIEIVHEGQTDEYPEEQLKALDKLIAYIDATFGTKCQIIDHKMWRTTNSDTSQAFAKYLEYYQTDRTHA